ncbi:MAG: hypothetical protein LWW85_03740, partial [Marinilabiliales bacterium]|nr:hypothetical protein [Marinilabiliales bacterium]
TIERQKTTDPMSSELMQWDSSVELNLFGKKVPESRSTLFLSEKGIESFTFTNRKIKIEAKCIND